MSVWWMESSDDQFGESQYPGALSPILKTFVAPFLPTRLTAPTRVPAFLRGDGVCKQAMCFDKSLVLITKQVKTISPHANENGQKLVATKIDNLPDYSLRCC